MDLLAMENMRVIPNPHIMVISPFKDIWERDTSPDKGTALAELTYIELMCSLKKTNPYAGYSDDMKPVVVSKAAFRVPDYKPDTLVKQAMKVYGEMVEEQLAVRLLNAAREAVEKLISYLRSMSLKERTKGGAAVYKPAEVMKALSEADKVLAALQNLKKKVEDDVYSNIKTRANRGLNPLEQ